MGRRAKPTKAKLQGKPARRSRKADDARVRDLEKRLAEALEHESEALKHESEALKQQAATAEILRVISSSPTDAQPVFEVIVRSAARLCHGANAAVFRTDGQTIMHPANYGSPPDAYAEVVRQYYPMPLTRRTQQGQAMLERSIVYLEDAEASSTPSLLREAAQRLGFRSQVTIPMLRDDQPVGAITVTRRQPGRFTDAEVALLKTFADQAVIAIENVRLFNETKEALERQIATSEILRVISQAPGDLQPVLTAVAQNAARLCDARDVAIVRLDCGSLRMVAGTGAFSEMLAPDYNAQDIPATRGSVTGRAITDRMTIHVHDLAKESEAEYPHGRALQRRYGHCTMLATPLLREGLAIGAISICRFEVRPFSESQIALLKTFADQAVIAIENVRLFKELEARNRDLTEALDQQTATAEILRVISSSPTDLQPVFDAIAESGRRLCDGDFCNVARYEDGLIHLAAHAETTPEFVDVLQRMFPMRPTRANTFGRTILERNVVYIRDVREEPEYSQTLAEAHRARSAIGVPMLRNGAPIGAIVVGGRKPRQFTDTQIALLQTFADQAVIAIENVRLFKELQTTNSDLTQALDQQTATSEILRTIAQTRRDVQPIFDTIVQNAARLCGASNAAVFLTDGRMLYHPANYGSSPEALADARALFPRPVDMDSVPGTVILTRSVVHVPDVEEPSAGLMVREVGRRLGFRSTVAVPMLREGEVIGSIHVARRQPGRFSEAEVALLKTFADQAVIAVENVRLLKELEERTQGLTRSVGELRALGEVGHAISSTLDLQTVLRTIVARATELSGTDAGVIYEYDESREIFVPRATERLEEEIVETMLATPVRKGEGATGQLAEALRPVELPDILAAPAESRVRGVLVRAGYQALLAVPLVREGRLLGGLTVIRKATGAFAPEVVELLQTFATQSALAIQNARLFLEIADKSRQLEIASQHKSEFLANMSHELRTPLNAVIGFSEVLLQRMFGALNDKQDEYLKDIYASGQHLLSLINDILDLSKIEAGRMELAPAPFHLPSALENAVTLVRERASRHGITLQVDIDPRLGEIVGDERKVKQVLLNLLSNAVKFTPEGGRISLKAGRPDGMVQIAVSDTGIGIAPEDQAAVFEEFRQVGHDETRKQEGTGLGLTLAKKFVELHGGRIWVESAPGRGSTFTFTLPVA